MCQLFIGAYKGSVMIFKQVFHPKNCDPFVFNFFLYTTFLV